MVRFFLILVLSVMVTAGCGDLRYEPSERQKQNAWIHHKTAAAAAQLASEEANSGRLRTLTELSELQSSAFVSYYGPPRELPAAESVDDLVADSSFDLARAAHLEAARRPDGWSVADNLLEIGVGISGLLGGVYGGRAVKFLRAARDKSRALKEIIEGNEKFKKSSSESVLAFKEAQRGQSPQTRQLVARLKG